MFGKRQRNRKKTSSIHNTLNILEMNKFRKSPCGKGHLLEGWTIHSLGFSDRGIQRSKVGGNQSRFQLTFQHCQALLPGQLKINAKSQAGLVTYSTQVPEGTVSTDWGILMPRTQRDLCSYPFSEAAAIQHRLLNNLITQQKSKRESDCHLNNNEIKLTDGYIDFSKPSNLNQ